MNIVTSILSFLLVVSVPAAVNGETQGIIALRGDTSSSIVVSACSSDTVTVAGNDVLKPGYIVAQADRSNMNNCDDICSFLFRKIVSNEGDGTYSTTLATFSDIFPTETYDAVLADTEVETVFECKEQNTYHRTLQTATSAPTAGGTSVEWYCEVYPYLNIVVLVFTTLSVIIPFLLPVVPFLVPITIIFAIVLAATNTCGVTWDNVLQTLLGGLRDAGLGAAERYREDRNNDRSLGQQLPFYPSGDEWRSISTNGDCDYVECNVGSNGSASTCFSEDAVTNDFNFDGMINMNKVVSTENRDMINAFSVLDYCYASSTFDKESCDSNTYKSLVDTCLGATLSQATTLLTTFPLALSDISSNCLPLSVMFYIGATKFGDDIHSQKQESQGKHNANVCNELITTKI